MNSHMSEFARMKQIFIIGGALLGTVLLFSSGQVVAQQGGQDQAARRSSADRLLEEIVVTARRREERLLDQPLSIAALTADQMQVQGIYTVEDVSKYVPNVTLTTPARANNTRVIIRGIGGGFPDPVFVFGSGMYIDGHYVPSSLGGYASTLDIERIELLRGPQGTLFGKNVIGGLVNIISTKPQPEFDSSIRLRLAEDGEQAVRGMVNIPFSDTLYGRFSAAFEEFDGYYRNQFLGIDSGGKELKAVRGALRYAPNDNWTFDGAVSVMRKDDDAMGGQCIGPGPLNDAPQWGGGAGNLERRLYTGARQDFWDLCAQDVAAGSFVHSSDKFTFSDVDEETVHLTVEWDSDGAVGALDGATITAKGSYRKMEYRYFADRDYTSWPVDGIGTYGSEGQNNETLGFEVLFEGDASDKLNFVVGINYFEEDGLNGEDICWNQFVASGGPGDVDANGDPNDPPQITTTCPSIGLHFELVPDNPNGVDIHPTQDPDLWPNAPRLNPFGPAPFLSEVSVFNKSIGIFGHLTYDINDQWTVDVGGRWTEDDREFHNIEFGSTGCDVSVDPNNHCTSTAPVSLFHIADTGFFNTAQDTFSEFTPMVSVTRRMASNAALQNGMFYFLYSEGFLTGGFNPELNSSLPATAPLLSYNPERVKNYELGFKGQFMEGRVQLMADVFYMDYTDQQKQIDLANPNNEFGSEDPVGIVQNVASSSITGLELELRASFWEGGFVSLDVSVLDNEIDEYNYEDPANPGQIVDLSNTLVNDFTPDSTVNLAVQHEFQLAGGATITPRAHMYWQDGFDWASTQGDYPKNAPKSSCYQDSYATFDARVTYQPANGDWQVAAFGGNLGDEEYIEWCSDTRNVWVQRLGRPRWFGVEFSAHFGRSN